ncbi:MAG: DUF4230 domain-containing protein [Exiguobacterium chiriqhucha]|uniref:DUF4230 domain-containing protein n=1 Tax=Exiguobacterium chiriqhucha TaxID=1385984 RepID=UPI00144F5D9E|nr:DUF4230 domain-containing protein [Exiguobacterium chiriqhucha]KAB2865930.1 MAG: DUF4230 domain-containing protein [Exiguobacterium chiriqhucha]
MDKRSEEASQFARTSKNQDPIKKRRYGVIISITLLIVLLGSMATWFFVGNASNEKSSVTVDQVREIATLATAEAHLTTTIEEENNELLGIELPFNLAGTKQKILLVVPGTVIAGVDLKEITSEDIEVNEETKQLAIVLPKASFLQEPAIDMNDVAHVSDEGVFRGEVTFDEGTVLMKKAQQNIKDKAVEIDLLTTAEENAEKFLIGFFDKLGYEVSVTFK